MTFIFWQNMISIHQKSFLEALARHAGVSKVLLVVAEDISEYRKKMGWDVPRLQGVDVMVAPSGNEIYDIISQYKNAIHIMSGLRAEGMLAHAFDACIAKDCMMGLMMEPFNAAGVKGALRGVKYAWNKIRFAKHIQFILAIGRQGVGQYTKLGFSKDIVFPWAYFISLDRKWPREEARIETKRIIYAGRLEAGKGIFRFTEELILSGLTDYTFDIYGTGPDEEKIKALTAGNELISIHPFLKHDELLKQYASHDWVVLPSSSKDGWGAIVSEGLLNGLKAITSDICGASWVVKEEFNGVTFNWTVKGDCKRAILAMQQYAYADATTISDWAKRAISGEAGATYFMNIMERVYTQAERPAVPWLTGNK